jgi:hypothetical protein
MKRLSGYVFMLLLMLGVTSSVQAQRHVYRMFMVNPAEIPLNSEMAERNFVLIPSFSGWAGFGKYTLVQDTDPVGRALDFGASETRVTSARLAADNAVSADALARPPH